MKKDKITLRVIENFANTVNEIVYDMGLIQGMYYIQDRSDLRNFKTIPEQSSCYSKILNYVMNNFNNHTKDKQLKLMITKVDYALSYYKSHLMYMNHLIIKLANHNEKFLKDLGKKDNK